MKKIALTLGLLVLVGVLPAGAQGVSFERYVALGDSITAGYASGGLMRFYQERSYPAMLAAQAGAPDFQLPLVSQPGLPPLLELQALAPSPVIVPSDDVPGNPINYDLPRPYNNLGIPGSDLTDLLTTTGDIQNLLAGNTDNVMHDLILRFPQVQDPTTGDLIDATALVQAIGLQPTFATLWIGNNDVLGAAVYGTPVDGLTMTPVDVFAALYPQAVGALVTKTNADIVLINLPNVTALPFTTTIGPTLDVPGVGTIPLMSDNGTVSPDSLVTLNASALLAQGYGLPGGPPLPDDLSIVGGQVVPGVILRPDEVAAITARVNAFNNIISSTAAQFGLPVLDVNKRFGDIAGGDRWEVGGVELSADFLTGGLFSYDGVHPQNIGYALVAVELIDLINQDFGMQIPQVNMNNVLCMDGCSENGPPAFAASKDMVFSDTARQRLMDLVPIHPSAQQAQQMPVAVD
jgi:lysophospholipase L1-like esterase